LPGPELAESISSKMQSLIFPSNDNALQNGSILERITSTVPSVAHLTKSTSASVSFAMTFANVVFPDPYTPMIEKFCTLWFLTISLKYSFKLSFKTY